MFATMRQALSDLGFYELLDIQYNKTFIYTYIKTHYSLDCAEFFKEYYNF